MAKQTIYLAADHGGFKLKESIKSWLTDLEHQVVDCGANELVDTDDYPDYASKLAKKVQKDSDSIGILFCRSGSGTTIVANKFRGIRAVDLNNTRAARYAILHNNANVVSLGADWVGGNQAKNIIRVYLMTKFRGEERHKRRLNKITKLEKSLLK